MSKAYEDVIENYKEQFAFPSVDANGNGDGGMTIRQWYAGICLQGLLSNPQEKRGSDELADAALDFAEALLKSQYESDKNA